VPQNVGNVDADPAFVNQAGHDYRLGAASPLIDLGNPAPGGPTLDRLGAARVTDGDGDGVAVRDMGAYEAPALPAININADDTTPPNTLFTAKPHKQVTRRRVTFGFASTEAGSSFLCRLDRHAWQPCTSPDRFKVKVGRHRFQVRARDAAGNTDLSPATYRFRRLR